MIEIVDKTDCCGCTACEAVCPQNCIRMEPDQDGFRYPVVNKQQCIGCKRCINVCPVRGKEKKTYIYDKSKEEMTQEVLKTANKPLAYACYYHDDKVRKNSTSGGIFTAIAQYVLKHNGIVYGVGYDEHFNIKHFSAENDKALEAFRGSKYVQSDQSGIYREVKCHLVDHRMVLYTGTPCQVAGLKKYLIKDYDNLITIDLFCHGVGSPSYWQKYLADMTKKYKSPVQSLYFREKTYGYNSTCMAIYFQNGKSSHRDHDSDLYLSPFSKCYIFRPSCYACAFKTLEHTADFSIGDYWNTSTLNAEYEKADGCTLMLCHSEKSKTILQSIQDSISTEEVSLYDALLINGGHQPSMYITSSKKPEKQDEFMIKCRSESIGKLVKEYMPMRLKTKIKCHIKPVLYRTGLLKMLKRIKK